MPVGVPYVEYQLPGSPEPEWINMYNALYRERMLFLCQEIEDTISNELIGLMLYLNAEDPNRALFLYINSPGGSVTCGIGIYDIMRYLNSGITTICMGTAASMASFILAGGTYGRRIALPNSRIMIHQPEGGSDGQATEILSESSEVARIRRQVGLIYANRTQQSIERIAQDLDRDQFMSAYEAKEYGLIDFVARSQKEEYEPGYDLLGLNTDNFQIPAFLKKLALGPVASGMESRDPLVNEVDSTLVASLPVIFPASGEDVPDLEDLDEIDGPTQDALKSSLKTTFSDGLRRVQADDQLISTGLEFIEPLPLLSLSTAGDRPSNPGPDLEDASGFIEAAFKLDIGEQTKLLKDYLRDSTAAISAAAFVDNPNSRLEADLLDSAPEGMRPLPVPTAALAAKLTRVVPDGTGNGSPRKRALAEPPLSDETYLAVIGQAESAYFAPSAPDSGGEDNEDKRQGGDKLQAAATVD